MLESDIDRLFREFKKIFGSSWVANFSSDEKSYMEMRELWFRALKKFNRRDISHGLSKCVESGKAFISLPEFVAMCKRSNHDKLYPLYKGLPAPLASDEVAHENLTKLKSILRGRRND